MGLASVLFGHAAPVRQTVDVEQAGSARQGRLLPGDDLSERPSLFHQHLGQVGGAVVTKLCSQGCHHRGGSGSELSHAVRVGFDAAHASVGED